MKQTLEETQTRLIHSCFSLLFGTHFLSPVPLQPPFVSVEAGYKETWWVVEEETQSEALVAFSKEDVHAPLTSCSCFLF